MKTRVGIHLVICAWAIAATAAEKSGRFINDKITPKPPLNPSTNGYTSWTFDGKEDQGKTPEGWVFRQTNPSQVAPIWQVIADPTAPSLPNVLTMTTNQSDRRTFNLAIEETGRFGDLDLTVRLKAVNGKVDQGGGPIWRCKDENNYYVCRINPLENNFRLYYVLNGERKQLASADVKTETGKWYTLRITMRGNRIMCYLDGVKLLEAQDETIKDAGKVGLWTKADAVSAFDYVIVTNVREK